MVLNSEFKLLTGREFLKSISSARHDWASKTPMQKWCYLYSIGKAASDAILLTLFKRDINKGHWLDYSIFVDAVVVSTLSSYTVLYYINRGAFILGLPSTCLAALICGVCCSYFSTLSIGPDIVHIALIKPLPYPVLKLFRFAGVFTFSEFNNFVNV